MEAYYSILQKKNSKINILNNVKSIMRNLSSKSAMTYMKYYRTTCDNISIS